MNDKQSNGREYWQSLSELAETPGALSAIENEFPGYDPNAMVSQSRRKFLQLAGASMALAGMTLTGCRRWPKELVVEQASRPAGRIPGEAEAYATVFEMGGWAQPLLVTSYDGRPIKIEGNPMHPQCATFGGKLGATTLFAQATVLEMYDPERSRSVVASAAGNNGAVRRQAASWNDFAAFAGEHFAKYKTDGAKLAVLTEQTSSPTTLDALDRFTKAFPGAKVYQYEAVSRDNQFAADGQSFGQPVRQVYDLTKADVIVSFDNDLLGLHPNALRQINDWAQRRRQADTEKKMNRMYVVESMYSTTGTLADVRHPSTTRKIEEMVLQLAHEAGLPESGRSLKDEEIKLVQQMWADLKAANGRALVAGGFNLRPEVLGVINAINGRLAAFGSTIALLPETPRKTHSEQIKELAAALNAGQVETLVILGGNPVYDAPSDLAFGGALGKAPTRIHLSLYDNETSHVCTWHVNRAHYLESWGDAVSYDGRVSVQQPTIEPLFNGRTPGELLAALTGDEVNTSQNQVYRTWSARLKETAVANSKAFRKVLHDGFHDALPQPVAVRDVQKPNVSFASAPEGLEVRFVPDYKVYDGRFANNGWLQECPDPVSKLTWDNVAYLSYADAQKLGLSMGDHTTQMLELRLGGKSLRIPGYILPGQPEGVITIPLGYGRTRAGGVVLTERFGSIGMDIGYDAYSVRSTASTFVAYGVKLADEDAASPAADQIANLGETVDVATTQTHHIIEPMGVDIRQERVGLKSQPGKIVHESTLKAFVDSKGSAPHAAAHKLLPLQLFPEPWTTNKPDSLTQAFNDPHAWGMAVDMNTCVGCNACVVACQAENNIPVVGKDAVMSNREMHWIRIDRYFKSRGGTYEEKISDPNPQVTYQPMMCVHCENAPCEQVCPVAATVHDAEGLNTMVYNRCIGTRYCQNNCPYKVRRFNYLDYQSKHPREGKFPWLGIPDTQQEQSVNKIRRLGFNPNVTVRMRGVIEKCTFCVQRIKDVTIDRRNEWQQGKRTKPTVDDFDVVTACQQACPAEAIVFGDINDPNALVSKLHKNQRSYGVLEELNNRPRTLHLAKLRNPATEPETAADTHH